MTDLHERAFVRRVKDPNPMLEELARQAVDALKDRPDAAAFLTIANVAQEFGVPIVYILDERERRWREGSGA